MNTNVSSKIRKIKSKTLQRKKMKTYLKICVHLIKMKRNGYCGANAPPSPLL